jgi:Family of unknown function (DUF5715)
MVEERSRVSSLKPWLIIIAAAFILITAFAGIYKLTNRRNSSPASLPNQADVSLTKALDPYRIAVQRVEEDRGEPMGNKAEVNVPPELKLYQDRRRFLAIQIAEWRKQGYEIPQDFSELAAMAQRGEFTTLPTLGAQYLLYGVGLKADDELTHYDPKTKKSIPLFGSGAEAGRELERLNDLLKESEMKVRELRNDLAKVKKNDRSARREISGQITGAQKSSAALKTRRDLIDSYYKDTKRSEALVAEYQKLAELAANFEGQSYDLNDAARRKAFKVSLLSALRPPARAQLEEIARAYQQKFERPLPVTSLVRTIEYQRYLGEAGNPNAIRIDVPPHTTGLAFDIYTYYMTAAEQQFLMDEIARLEREGRVEALRENRFHIHVFVFADGVPPDEKLIKESLNLKATGAGVDVE